MRIRSRLTFVGLVGIAATVVVLAPGQAHAAGTSGLRHAAIRLSNVTVSSPTLPTPSAADGVGPGDYLLIYTTPAAKEDGAVFICTANYVWQDSTGKRYLGAAGHCFLPSTEGGSTIDPAMVSGSDPYVDHVDVCVSGCAFGGQLGSVGIVGNFVTLGSVVYARQWSGDVNSQVGNDFGLVEIPSTVTAPIRASVPVWGGPSAGAATTSPGSPVCLYGNGVGAGETFPTKARTGVLGGVQNGAWFAAIPSTPGDSGSPLVNCVSATTAVGLLTHLDVGDGPGFVAGTTVDRAVAMAQADAHLTLSVLTAP